MPVWIDTPGEVATILGIAATVIGVLFWLVRTKVDQVLHEVHPNSGISLRDAVDRIEKQVDRLNDKLDGHIDWHLTKEK
jgi:hypothetical protein